jgi:hypothetical protein
MNRTTRVLVVVMSSAFALIALPASAGAVVRTGSVQDPAGDASALFGPVLDLKSVAVRYDDVQGSLRVTWSYYNDVVVAGAGASFLDGGGFEPSGSNPLFAGVLISWSASLTGPGNGTFTASVSVPGAGGIPGAVATLSNDRRSVTLLFTHAGFAGRDWMHSRGPARLYSGDTYDDFAWDGSAPETPADPPVDPPADAPAPTPPPTSGDPDRGPSAPQGMTINDGAVYTNDPDVTLSVVGPKGVDEMQVANDGGFRAARRFPLASTIPWRLAESGTERLPKTVYVRFGGDVQTFTDDIILDQTKPSITSATLKRSEAASARAASLKPRNFRIAIAAKDVTSGVDTVQFAGRGRRQLSKPQKFSRLTRYRATIAPEYARVRDRAGNRSRWLSIR